MAKRSFSRVTSDTRIESRRARVQTYSPLNPRVSGRQVDLLVLAGCSCVLTLVCHPGDVLQSRGVGATSAPVQTHVRASGTVGGAVAYTIPERAGQIEEEDEEA
jgi:hypothetical protein